MLSRSSASVRGRLHGLQVLVRGRLTLCRAVCRGIFDEGEQLLRLGLTERVSPERHPVPILKSGTILQEVENARVPTGGSSVEQAAEAAARRIRSPTGLQRNCSRPRVLGCSDARSATTWSYLVPVAACALSWIQSSCADAEVESAWVCCQSVAPEMFARFYLIS